MAVPRRGRRRVGALLSAEMLIVTPVVMVMAFGMVEASLLISSYNQLKHASAVGARVCSVSPGDCRAAVTAAVQEVLIDERLIEHVEIVCEDSGLSGEICRVTLSIEMSEAAPNLLAALGFSLVGRELNVATAMRKE